MRERRGRAPPALGDLFEQLLFLRENAAGARDGDVLVGGFELVAVVEEESGVDRGMWIAQLIGREVFQDLDPLCGPGRYRYKAKA